MAVSIFLNFAGSAGDPEALAAAFVAGPLPELQAATGLRFVETFRPAAGAVPEFGEDAGPALLAEINVDSLDDAERLLRSATLRDALRLSGSAARGETPATVDVFHAVHFPLPGHARPPPRTAPLSFVVRYYRPVKDEYAFANFYTSHHPLLLARFPGIRNVLCYLPTGLGLPAGIDPSGAFFGNEVVFDDLDSLNRALASDVLPQLRAEGKLFPSYGRNTHHAMLRNTVHSRVD